MTPLMRLAWRYVAYHRGRTAVLALCIALVVVLPVAVELLVGVYRDQLEGRANATPMVVGAPGSPYDLLLHSIYFRGDAGRSLGMLEVINVREGGLALPVPIYLKDTAEGHPVVGTTGDYHRFRRLQVASGRLPLRLGEALLGSETASALGLSVGDRILSDSGNLYDISSTYPLKMQVVGVLAPSGSADDGAVFVDLKTTWVIRGIGHGHDELDTTSDPNLLISQEASHVIATSAVVEYTEITDENRDSFHFHAGPDGLPITAFIAEPIDERSGTILRSRLRAREDVQLLVPIEQLREMMSVVFQVKRFLDANGILVTVSTGLLLALIIALDLRVRRRQMETLMHIGAPRGTVGRLVALEMSMTISFGLLLAAAVVTIALVWLASGPVWLPQ
ncbi:MAG TPA: hypothetical protein EYN79_00735 [Planctomycetes bacterium]|nr:hypothetical protein [Planctomycetota bacterium]HIN80869.1 hypothetical protein [Planctomycetota bacterium]